ncbi:TPA: hypothetical protein N0F65_004992 [Lagenidium giganteum]|uniref:Uncharacterized protein n=1 Tax=Lagenidium giganteum TaxID=4803 RepID=A0AAV2ZL03_9STRA|nr:TPA: hypothetical protein N0F65_004992 [Lagenidium giganteum]
MAQAQVGSFPRELAASDTRRGAGPPLLVFDTNVPGYDRPLRLLVDSGASENVCRLAPVSATPSWKSVREDGTQIRVRLAHGHAMYVPMRSIDLHVEFEDFSDVERFLVIDMDDRYDLILGIKWLVKHEPCIDWRSGRLMSSVPVSERHAPTWAHITTPDGYVVIAGEAKPLRTPNGLGDATPMARRAFSARWQGNPTDLRDHADQCPAPRVGCDTSRGTQIAEGEASPSLCDAQFEDGGSIVSAGDRHQAMPVLDCESFQAPQCKSIRERAGGIARSILGEHGSQGSMKAVSLAALHAEYDDLPTTAEGIIGLPELAVEAFLEELLRGEDDTVCGPTPYLEEALAALVEVGTSSTEDAAVSERQRCYEDQDWKS